MDYSKYRDYGEYLEECAEEAAYKAEREYEQQGQQLQGEYSV